MARTISFRFVDKVPRGEKCARGKAATRTHKTTGCVDTYHCADCSRAGSKRILDAMLGRDSKLHEKVT